MFKDRTEAATRLAIKLQHYKNKDVVVLAIPRGGLPLGAIVAESLNAPLDVALSKKIGHPVNKEFAIGAVSMDSRIISDTTHISEDYIEDETKRIRDLLTKRHDQYYKHSKPQNLKDKIVIIVDDGIATGNTVLATIELVSKKKPAKIILAIPVAPPKTINKMKRLPNVDEVICLQAPSNFMAVGQFYDEFFQVSDEEAISLLETYNRS